MPRDFWRPVTGWSRGVVVLGLFVLTGCASGAVAINAPSLSDGDAAACRDLVAALPSEVNGEKSRELSGDTDLGAAWGDPGIVLTCGVPPPAEFTDTSTCIEANGVGWFVPDSVLLSDDETLDVTMTAVGYRPRVQVVLPGDYRPDGFLAVAATVGGVIDQTLPLREPCR